MSAITLDQMLSARDARAELERRLCHEHPACTLVVLTVVLPGSVKRSQASLTIARAACGEVEATFAGRVDESLQRDLETGYEGYWLVRADALSVKRLLVSIEENHPLGRLFDLDVVRPDGVPVSRREVGYTARRCLLCEHEARYCMRNKSHSYNEMLQKIAQMTSDYERSAF